MNLKCEEIFLTKWILANGLGLPAAGIIGMFIYWIFFPHYTPQQLGTIPAYAALTWTLFGLIQWLVLRKKVPNARLWTLATAIGALIGSVAVKLLSHSIFMSEVLALFLFGFLIGFAQYQILGRRFIHASWWILATASGWVLTGVLGGIGNTIVALISGFAFAFITGFVLVWIYQRPLPPLKKEVS